jgi:hypothetical protein
MVLSRKEPIRSEQIAHVAGIMGDAFTREISTYDRDLAALRVRDRLSFLDVVISPLRAMSVQQYTVLGRLVRTLMEWDSEIDLFEYCVHRALLRHLDHYFGLASPQSPRVAHCAKLAVDIDLVIGMLARATHNPKDISAAFEAGTASLPNIDRRNSRLPHEDLMSLTQLDDSLDRLAELVPAAKKEFLSACVTTVLFDQQIEEKELALIRAVADSLDCPMPPAMLAS